MADAFTKTPRRVRHDTHPRPDPDRPGGAAACQRKRAYATWEEAEQACREVLERHGNLNWGYRCDHCGAWHISQFSGIRTSANLGPWYWPFQR